MNYLNLKASYHTKQAELKYKKALENMLVGNIVKAEHYTRLAQTHNKNAEYYTKESNKILSDLFLQG